MSIIACNDQQFLSVSKTRAMPPAFRKALLIESDHNFHAQVLAAFEGSDKALEIVHADTLSEGLKHAKQGEFEVVLLDLELSDSSGLETLIRFHDHFPTLPVIAITDLDDEALGQSVVQAGAQTFLVKDEIFPKLLRRAANYAVFRKHQELDLDRAKTEAEHANALKDKFISLVSHDLRGPLGALTGLLEVMLHYGKHPLSDEQRNTLEHVVRGGKALQKVVEDLLDISRLKTGKIAPEKEFFDAHWAVETVVQRLTPIAAAKHITIDNAVQSGTRLFADSTLFSQVLQNLLSNAIKFSPEHDGVVHIDCEAEDHARIRVTDNGVGMNEEVQQKLFRLEEKVSTPGTAGEEGTGFGMPFSYDIMRAHGGDLSVFSQIGEGSTFTAALPIVRPKVLLIDDEKVARTLARVHLQGIGVDVVEAENGVDALNQLEEGLQPDLIVCDIIMPEMDGFEVLQRLKENPVYNGLPVIMVTGDDRIDTREKALGMGADDFTTKPVVVHDFIPRVRRYVG